MSGERTDGGIGLATLGRVTAALSDALRTFGRLQNGEPARRAGALTARDEALTDLRLLGTEPGSVVLVLGEPPATIDEPTLAQPSHLAFANFDALIRAIAEGDLDPEVLDPLDQGLTSLGPDGSLGFIRGDVRVDVDRGYLQAARSQRGGLTSPVPIRVAGRMRALDLDRTTMGIRSADGVEWTCTYSAEIERMVLHSIDQMVVAHGTGQKGTARRGRLQMTALTVVPETVQTALFVTETLTRDELLTGRNPSSLTAIPSVVGDDVSDEEAARFFEALAKD